VVLIDQDGRPVVGAEDIAPMGPDIYVSAYDRPAVESAVARADGPEPPAGGLYLVPAAALAAHGPVRVTDLIAPALGQSSRPHGIDAVWIPDDTGPNLAAVVRNYRHGRDGWRLEASIVRLSPEGKAQVTPAPEEANDVIWQPLGASKVSLDGGRGFAAGKGRVVRLGEPGGPVTLRGALDFANGLAIDRAGRTWIAETRADRITDVASGRQIALPGGPDNLTLAPDGRILAALHPSLVRYALHRFGWPGGDRAATRIVAVDPDSGATEVLLDDPDGATFSGATVAAQAGGFLVLGAVREPGLLVCPLP